MLVCLHFPSAYSQPVGIWWWDAARNVPTAYYLPGSENYYASAVDTLGSARDQTHWNMFTKKLADRTPYGSNFEVDDVQGDPAKYLKTIRKVKP